MPFANPVHRAGKPQDGEPRFESPSDTAGSALVEVLPRQIVLAVLPSGNFRGTRVFELVPIMGVLSPSGRRRRNAL